VLTRGTQILKHVRTLSSWVKEDNSLCFREHGYNQSTDKNTMRDQNRQVLHTTLCRIAKFGNVRIFLYSPFNYNSTIVVEGNKITPRTGEWDHSVINNVLKIYWYTNDITIL
jgi:hypothetical protein